MGRAVPFHIHTIKNASKSDESEWSFLRINFPSPGQGVGRKNDQPFVGGAVRQYLLVPVARPRLSEGITRPQGR